MILTNRRLRLLYLALAGMDMAVLLPWLTNVSIFWARNGDLRAVVHAVPRVKRISLLRIYECDPATRLVRHNAAGPAVVIGRDELVCSGNHAVSCSRD